MTKAKLQQLSSEWATQYNRIKNETKTITEANLYYDNIFYVTPEGYNLVQEFFNHTGLDFFSSDRETASFVLACNTLGILDDIGI